MLHTPRLCIDGRAAAEFPVRGLLAQELIDQLVAAQGEAKGPGEWVERQRTVLVSHPGQVFSGQLRSFNTRRRIGRSPLYALWENHFVRNAHISAFHRFRPVDRMAPALDCQTINTVLPPRRSLPRRVPFGVNHKFIVPSRRDASLLADRFGIPESQVFAFRPGVRRYVHHTPGPAPLPERGRALFLLGTGVRSVDRLVKLLKACYASLSPVTFRLDRMKDVSPRYWVNQLESARLVFYLEAKPFDWGTLPLEAIHWRIPVVFPDENGALAEALRESPLRLSRFLLDPPAPERLDDIVERDRRELGAQGVLDPFSLAMQYAEVYETLLPLMA